MRAHGRRSRNIPAGPSILQQTVRRFASASPSPRAEKARPFIRQATLFALIGLVLYGGLCWAAERLVYAYAQRNRFYMVKTAPHAEYDHVILGASHAGVSGYQDVNARLEAMTDSKI